MFGSYPVISCARGNTILRKQNESHLNDTMLRIETGLVLIGERAQPQWNQTASLTDRMQHYKVPGVSIAVIDNFSIDWARGYGLLRLGEDIPVTTRTLFQTYCVAEPISAVAALLLVQQGKVSLDENINNKLSSWKIPENNFTKQEKVTLRRLLSHSGGLQDSITNRSPRDAAKPSVKIEQLLKPEPNMERKRLTHVTMIPGSQYRYTNTDYEIIKRLILDLTGKPFPTFMQEIVLRPLGMTLSTYDQPLATHLRDNTVVGPEFSGKSISRDLPYNLELTRGDFWTTPSDLARFIIEIMKTYHGRPGKVVSQKMSVEMLSEQIEIYGDPFADIAGLGFQLSKEGKGVCIVHAGATSESTSILWAYPETGEGVIIMTNSATGSLLCFEILLSVAREYKFKWLNTDSLAFYNWLRDNNIPENDSDLSEIWEGADAESYNYVQSKNNRLHFLKLLFIWQKQNNVNLPYNINVPLYSQLMGEELHALFVSGLEYKEVKKISENVLKKYLDDLSTLEYLSPIEVLWLKKRGGSGLWSPHRYRNTYGRIKTDVKPKNSEVYINEKFIGYSEKEFVVPEGNQTINIKHTGYESFTNSLVIKGGKKVIVSCTLKKNK